MSVDRSQVSSQVPLWPSVRAAYSEACASRPLLLSITYVKWSKSSGSVLLYAFFRLASRKTSVYGPSKPKASVRRRIRRSALTETFDASQDTASEGDQDDTESCPESQLLTRRHLDFVYDLR